MNDKGLRFSVIAALCIGVTILFNKAVLNAAHDPFEYVAWTFIFAALLSVGVYRTHITSIKHLTSTDIKKLIITGILTFGIAQVCNILGQSRTSGINAGFLSTLSSLFTIPFARMLVNERIPTNKGKYIVVLFVGIYLLSVGTNGITLAIGDLLLIISAVILGFSNAYVRLLGKSVSYQLITILQLIIGSLFLYGVMYSQTKTFLPDMNMIGIYILSGSLTMIIASSIFKAITISGPIRAMLVIDMYPLIALVGSILILGEAARISQIVGGILIMLATYTFIKR